MKALIQLYKPTFFLAIFILLIFTGCTNAQDTDLDKKVKSFLNSKGGAWYDMNVPSTDGQLLYDIIVKNGYKSALEIGTSTGHSGIWIAWALSKTGGKLITLEIDESRHREALANFEKAGLSEYIDARLGDAHEIVKELEGPFDFVFSDADKGWYRNYFLDLHPKLKAGGCYTTHNISKSGWNRDYYDFIMGQEKYESTLDSRGGGMLISYKKAE